MQEKKIFVPNCNKLECLITKKKLIIYKEFLENQVPNHLVLKTINHV